MPTLFRVESKDINALNELQLTKLLKVLPHLEAKVLALLNEQLK